MNTKVMNFLGMSWFISTLICLILEGSYFGATENSLINQLSVMSTFNIGNLITVPVFNVGFAQGLMKLILWDYSFYTGGYVVFRYFWLITLSPGVIWGMIQVFISLYGSALSLFKLFS